MSEQNDLNQYRKTQALVRQNEFVPFDPDNNRMLIVHPTRRQLTNIEKTLHFVGPYNLSHALASFNAGDALLVHDGRHKLDGELYRDDIIW